MKFPSQMPPKIFHRFFRWYCHPVLLDHIEGDLLEEYGQRLNKSGKRKADLKFMIDVLLLFSRGIIRPAKRHGLSSYGMYKSYFRMGWRNLAKSKGYSAINITGLAIGLACCLSIELYILDEYSYDRFHKKGSNIYRVVQHQTKQGVVYDLASTPGGRRLRSRLTWGVEICHRAGTQTGGSPG